MPSLHPLPHTLAPYLTHSTHSPQSLTLITSVLATTPNWLLLRYLYSVLSDSTTSTDDDDDEDYDGYNARNQEENNKPQGLKGRRRRRGRTARRIVFVSFMRNWSFWRGESKRLGLDLQRFVDANKFRFVDGLTGLFSGDDVQQHPQQQQQQARGIRPLPSGSVPSSPIRRSSGSLRAPPPLSSSSSPSGATTSIQGLSQAKTPAHLKIQSLHISGRATSSALRQLEKDILGVINELRKTDVRVAKSEDHEEYTEEDDNDVLLILDQPDLILAAVPGIDANEMSEFVMELQQHVHSVVLTTAAEFPLIHKAHISNQNDLGEQVSATPLEKNHASLSIGMAHRASLVLQLRTLDTGAAKDVSGVLRLSRGGSYEQHEGDEVVEREVLYYIQRDGGVRVFGRGESTV